MDENKLRRLLYQYLDNTITPADCVELLDYLNTHPEKIAEILDTHDIDIAKGPEFYSLQADQVFERIVADKRYHPNERKSKGGLIITLFNKQWLKVAAIFVVACTVAVVELNHRVPQQAKPKVAATTTKAIILPGSNKATLTIANNKVIVLGNQGNGVIAKLGSLNVHKVNNSVLVYKDSKSTVTDSNGAVVMNTLATPRGGQYQVELEDGTKVWLNSASSITYPNKFTGKTREVKLTGEAYFEVAKNKDKPFFVSINNVQVRVLGTHFNIAAYNDDDNITTTLLEGSVQMTKNNSLVLLKPGQHGIVKSNNDDIKVSTADIDQAMAWKNGLFSFNDENITDIMKKISRWYDVDVEYKGKIQNQRFGGVYSRSKGITQLLSNLQKLGNIHFEIHERRVIVMD